MDALELRERLAVAASSLRSCLEQQQAAGIAFLPVGTGAEADDPGGPASLVVLTAGSVRGGPLATVTGPGRPIDAVVDVTADGAVDRLRELATEVPARPKRAQRSRR